MFLPIDGPVTFYVDQGAVYDLWKVGGVTYVQGRKVKVTYRSQDNRVRLTGKWRRQRALGKTAAPYTINGQRAVLDLDTGEGITELHGVVHHTNPELAGLA